MIVSIAVLSFMAAQSMMSAVTARRIYASNFLDIAITPDVMDVQHEMGSDGCGSRRIASAGENASAPAKRR
jgi:hypothetical protein